MTPRDQDLAARVTRYQNLALLRFLTCGSVDDGKSTLVGRLLCDADAVSETQLADAMAATRRAGTMPDGQLDYAMLLDGLEQERQQGITIDVAWRYFATRNRKFIIADTPGHEQYTANMATGASRCDLAVILVDATRGVREQTKRHAYIARLLGIRQLIVAVNKMDLLGWSEQAFRTLRAGCQEFLAKLPPHDAQFVPVAATSGDNLVRRSAHMPWYEGPPLLELLERAELPSARTDGDLRVSIEGTARTAHLRGSFARVLSGALRVGDELAVLPSLERCRVRAILCDGGEVGVAVAPMSVTLLWQDDIDLSRGDLLASPSAPPTLSSALRATLVWMADGQLRRGDSLLLRHLATTVPVTIDGVEQRIDPHSLRAAPASELARNDIAEVALTTHQRLPHDAYEHNRATGRFILIDRASNATVAMGMLLPTHEAPGATPPVNAKGHTVWLGELADASAVRDALVTRLRARGQAVLVLNAAALEAGLLRDLAAPAHAAARARRIAEVCRLAETSGLVVLLDLPLPELGVSVLREALGEALFEARAEPKLALGQQVEAVLKGLRVS